MTDPGTILRNISAIQQRRFLSARLLDTSWTDVPVTCHNHANGISFADGPAEIKKWKDTGILGRKVTAVGVAPRDGGKDWQWPRDRSTYRK